ncbi:winged helix-turn-helix domain-containing protein [Methanosarcina sp. KYL-1]|nr:winged helix-turn-helix domain-containing protein [Methanosarcina sp. KYL-1]
MEEIKTLLDVSPTSILPQIKRLTDSSLVVQRDGVYELTDLGEQVVKKVRPLVNVLSLLETNDYWLEHDLSGIPQYLQERLGDLKGCQLFEPDPSQIFEPSTDLLHFFSTSRYMVALSSFYRPEFLPLYSRLGRTGAEVSMIFTESVLEKTLYNYEKKIKKFAGMGNTELFACNDGVRIAELIISDRGMILSLFARNGRFYHDYVFCPDPQAIQWGMELFEFYKSGSWKIEDAGDMEHFECTSRGEPLPESLLFSLQ